MRISRNRPFAARMTSGLVGTTLGAGVALSGVGVLPSPGVQAALAAPATTVVAAAASKPAPPVADGLAEPDGSLYTPSQSWPASAGLARPVVAWAARPGGGAWEAASDGGVFSRGGARFHGSTGGDHLAEPVVGMAATPSGGGYWLVAADGGVFSFGNARFYGSTGGDHLAEPIVGMAATPSGGGYWLVAADGGVFSFGNARFHGSTGRDHLVAPVVGMASAPSGKGYWLVASDGGIFPFGAAGFDGSAAGEAAGREAAAVSVTAAGNGYDEVLDDGSFWSFGDGRGPARHQIPVPASELAEDRAAAAASKAVDAALGEVGSPYAYGAAGPAAFDCSGLTQYAYAAAGIRLPRSAAEQFAATARVAAADLEPGDLVFFYPGITHVGVYLGNGLMVDAPHTGATVRVESIEWFGPLMGVGRPSA
jgi:hypothetical protein